MSHVSCIVIPGRRVSGGPGSQMHGPQAGWIPGSPFHGAPE
ncbi:MAG: hypothetical protein OJF62_001361 [Pseudolabrys sp.]|nr:hypothetical protein [Pseudolabrys sp.]